MTEATTETMAETTEASQGAGRMTVLSLFAKRSFVVTVAIAFVIAFALMNTLVPVYFASQSNGGVIVEMGLFYADNLIEVLQAYGEAGRACYIKISVLFDIAFPMLYSLCFTSLAIHGLGSRVGSRGQKVLLSLGVILFLSDWLENALIITAIVRYPDIGAFAYLAQAMTLLKTALTVVLLVVIGVAIVMAIHRRATKTKGF